MDAVGVVAPLDVLPSAKSVSGCCRQPVVQGELGASERVGGDLARGDSKPEVEDTGELSTRGVL